MDGMILKRGSGGSGNLKTIDENYVATSGQTVFPIAYETFDYKKDTVFVASGRTTLSEGLDYTVTATGITLIEGVPKDRTVTIRIMKNVNTDAKDSTMSGVYIEKGSMPLNRLAEPIDVSADIEAHNTREDAHSGILAPMYTYGTTDLTAGTSALETGKIYLVYE
jgi:hypothetical protein